MRRLFRYLPILLILLLAIWAGCGLFKYEVAYTQDLKHHLIRSYDAIITLKEGHFPLRWAGILNYECGVPMFNFYNPLLYYLVALLYSFTSHILLSIKIVSFLSLIVGSLFFYFWIKEETNDSLAGVGGGILYLFAPYTFLLVFVRGSPEYLAYAVMPIVFYFYSKAFNAKKEFRFNLYLFLAALSGALLAISHNVVFIVFIPVLLVYLLLKLLLIKPPRNRITFIIFSFISIFGIGAFFIFPAILEKGYTKLDIPIFNYQDHFPTLVQVLNSKWGYGDSAIGTHDDAMSFQLGYSEWIVLAITFAWLIIKLKYIKRNILAAAFFVLSLGFLFLVLPWSLPVWSKLSVLQSIQFSWRLLGICVFTIAALFAFWLARIKMPGVKILLLVGISLVAIIGNRNHLLPQPVLENDLPFYRELDQIGSRRRFLTANAETVLPPNAKLSCYLTTPIVTAFGGKKVSFNEVVRGSTFGSISLFVDKKVLKDDDKLIFNLGYFPGNYHFKLNSKDLDYGDCQGLVCFDVSNFSDGENSLSWRVGQTRLETLFNFVSIVFLGVWGVIVFNSYFSSRIRKKK
jgi:hypothetical protein